MSELLSVNLKLLRKMKSLWISIPCFLFLEILSDIPKIEATNNKSYMSTVTLISTFPEVLIPAAVFIGLFYGREISRGLIKSKIIAGHKRTEIYLSYFFTGCIIVAAWLAAYSAVSFGIIFYEGLFLTVWEYILTLILIFLSGIMVAAVLTLVFSLQNSGTGCIICCIVVVAILWMAGLYLQEYVGSVSTTPVFAENGELIMVDQDYALERGSIGREIAENVYVSVPVIQIQAICDLWGFDLYVTYMDCSLKIILTDIAWLVILMFTGIMVFRNKKVR